MNAFSDLPRLVRLIHLLIPAPAQRSYLRRRSFVRAISEGLNLVWAND